MSLPQNDFPHEILKQTDHRPWPMPDGPWIMTQSWHDLLFAHWPVDARSIQPRLPPRFELDVFEGQAWLGIIPFHMTNVAPRGVPALPYVSAFPELNVRTYVRVGGTPGVYFFSLDARSRLAVAAARTLFHLPYHWAAMEVNRREDGVHYSSRRRTSDSRPAEWVARYLPTGEARRAARGSLEYFLTERYCLFTVDKRSHAYRVDIHHPPWPLQDVRAEIIVNTMAQPAEVALPPVEPALHYARRQDVVAWPPTRLLRPS
jgi:uncharacterized protein YqjF (DUF2071 family)